MDNKNIKNMKLLVVTTNLSLPIKSNPVNIYIKTNTPLIMAINNLMLFLPTIWPDSGTALSYNRAR